LDFHEGRLNGAREGDPECDVLRLYTLEQAADLLQTTPAWLRERARRRAVPYRRLGRNEVTFTSGDLEQIVSQALREPRPSADGPVGRRRRR
jgi:hypothetical protein